MMRLTGIDALQRGISNLLANWQLVLVNLVQSLLVTLLMVAGIVPIVLVVGVGTVRGLFETDLQASGPPLEVIDELMLRVAESAGQLILATLVAAVVWTIGLLVLAYFQAGVFGTLAAGNRKAPFPVAGVDAFRVFSLSLFKRSADRLTWRFFWLINLFLALASVPLLLLGGALLGVAWLATSESIGGAVALGCIGVFLTLVFSFVCSIWWQLSMAAAADGQIGFGGSIAHGWTVLFRRLGAVLVLVLLAIVAGIAMAIVFVPVGIVVDVAVRDSLWAYIAGQVVMMAFQTLLNGGLTVAFSGALVALVRGEMVNAETQVV